MAKVLLQHLENKLKPCETAFRRMVSGTNELLVEEAPEETNLRGIVVDSRSQVQNSVFSATSGEQKR